MVTPEEKRAFDEEITRELMKKYSPEKYLTFLLNNTYACANKVKEVLLEAIGKEKFSYLNMPQFEKVLEEPAFMTEHPTLVVATGKERISRRKVSPVFSDYTVYYVVISKKILAQVCDQVRDIPPKEYLVFLKTHFTRMSPSLTYYTKDMAPFLSIHDDIEFWNYHYHRAKHPGSKKIRTQTFSLPVKCYEDIWFTVKQNNKSWGVTFRKVFSEKFQKIYEFEWYSEKYYWPIIIYDVELQIPATAWNTLLFLTEAHLKRPKVADETISYTLPVIAFEIRRNLFLLGRRYIAKRYLSDSFPWRQFIIYYPKKNTNFKQRVITVLKILDHHDAHFLPKLEKSVKSIVISFELKGMASGAVSPEPVGETQILFIDLSWAGVAIATILHEFLHYMSAIVHAPSTIRESLTQIATYLLLPPPYLGEWRAEVLKGTFKLPSGYLFTNYQYSLLPLVLYENYVKGHEQSYCDLFFSPTLEDLKQKIRGFFAQKRLYEELIYLIDFEDELRFLVERETKRLIHEEGSRMALYVIIIYYNKEEITDHFTRRLYAMRYGEAGYILKDVGTSETIVPREHIKWISFSKYRGNIPKKLQAAINFVRHRK